MSQHFSSWVQCNQSMTEKIPVRLKIINKINKMNDFLCGPVPIDPQTSTGPWLQGWWPLTSETDCFVKLLSLINSFLHFEALLTIWFRSGAKYKFCQFNNSSWDVDQESAARCGCSSVFSGYFLATSCLTVCLSFCGNIVTCCLEPFSPKPKSNKISKAINT